jgi:hypothetical protein
MLRNWLQEPLLHFLLAGGLLFGVYGWLDRGGGEPSKSVRITAAEMNWLKETWTRQWQRPPDEAELRHALTGYLKEELLAREARELGLDYDDTVVRRRLAQKMEFFLQDALQSGEPGEEVLRVLYDARRENYRAPDRISFTQRYFASEAAAIQGLEQLARSPEEVNGEPTLLPPDHADADPQTLASLFGGPFAERLFTLEPGAWQGPVKSGYGFHLVLVLGRQAGEVESFEAARSKVRDEWYRIEQAKAAEQFYASLLKKYQVVVDDDVKPMIGDLAGAMR